MADRVERFTKFCVFLGFSVQICFFFGDSTNEVFQKILLAVLNLASIH